MHYAHHASVKRNAPSDGKFVKVILADLSKLAWKYNKYIII